VKPGLFHGSYLKRLGILLTTAYIAFLVVFLSKCGIQNGKVSLRLPDGSRYTGNLKDGLPNGGGS